MATFDATQQLPEPPWKSELVKSTKDSPSGQAWYLGDIELTFFDDGSWRMHYSYPPPLWTDYAFDAAKRRFSVQERLFYGEEEELHGSDPLGFALRTDDPLIGISWRNGKLHLCISEAIIGKIEARGITTRSYDLLGGGGWQIVGDLS